jgi:hypothetical protein
MGEKMTASLEEFMKTATKAQKAVLIELHDLGEQEQRFSDEVNRINNSIKSGLYSPDGHSVTICEDSDDAAVISIEPRKKLENIREDMKECMLKAVALGMGDLGIIMRNFEHYVGSTLTKPPFPIEEKK